MRPASFAGVEGDSTSRRTDARHGKSRMAGLGSPSLAKNEVPSGMTEGLVVPRKPGKARWREGALVLGASNVVRDRGD